MQKKLLTMAVAGALAVPGLALAQRASRSTARSNVVRQREVRRGRRRRFDFEWDVASHASNYGLPRQESLGAGLTAWFRSSKTRRWNAPQHRHTPASRNSAVGLQERGVMFSLGSGPALGRPRRAVELGTVAAGPVTSIIGRRETTARHRRELRERALVRRRNPGAPTPTTAGAAGGAPPVGTPLPPTIQWNRRRRRPSILAAALAVDLLSVARFGGAQAKFMYQTNEGKSNAGVSIVGAQLPGQRCIRSSMYSARCSGRGGRKVARRRGVRRHKDFST